MNSKLRVIVTGLIAQYPLGGVAWDYVQYVLGLHDLGHDVYYFEDTGLWPFNPLEGGVSEDCNYNVEYLHQVMSRFELENRWAYRFPWGDKWYGLSEKKRRSVIDSADIVLNVSGSLANPEHYRSAGTMVYVDSDPVFTQIKLKRGQADFRKAIDVHDICFSFGEKLPSELALTGHEWLPTRQPIVLSQWHPGGTTRDVFTTIMNWTSYKPVEHEGKTYGQKDVEFMRFLGLPKYVPGANLEIAVNAGKVKKTPRELLIRNGWQVVHPDDVCPDMDSYREYIETSKAEWSVAKHGYVAGPSGWFSCRSACYLAAGKPVIVQDTGFSDLLPCGEGVLTFANLEEAISAVESVQTEYDLHSEAARAIAETYFDAKKVVTAMLETIGPNKRCA